MLSLRAVSAVRTRVLLITVGARTGTEISALVGVSAETTLFKRYEAVRLRTCREQIFGTQFFSIDFDGRELSSSK